MFPLHLYCMGSSVRRCWTACEGASVCPGLPQPEPTPAPDHQAFEASPRPHALGLPAPSLLQPGQPGPQGAPGTAPTLSGSSSLPTPPSNPGPQGGCSYVRPLLQDQERYLFCLIHRNKHRKLNKVRRQRNMFQMRKQEKQTRKKNPNKMEIIN